tara:strand:- start:12319 stop:13932 length:1614 start_codon:yes stop_codon:yes gene_type:complete
MNILGIHGGVTVGQHDAAAALVIDGALVCSIEEERLTRIKTSTGLLPVRSIKACLDDANLSMHDIDLIVTPGETYEDIIPRTKEWISHHFGHAPKILPVNHQTAHIASSFFHSDFDDAMCLSYDAFGDRLSGAIAKADKKKGIEIIETFPIKKSLGIFYATMTSFLGFKPGEDEYKVMGLAPYGKPNIDLSFFCKPTKDGNIVDLSFFRERKNATLLEPFYSNKLVEKIGKPRLKESKLTDYYKNLASSTQFILEECAISNVKYLHSLTKKENLCLAGGVALNCSANGLIAKLPFIKKLFVQPASSDRGLALGCALLGAHKENEKIKPIKHVFYGPKITNTEIEKSIKISGVEAKFIDNPSETAADLLNKKKILAWFQGRSEFGPRALGHRSILADPSHSDMKDLINAKVKFREEFRPFAPSVLEEEYQNIFDLKIPSPYMTVACGVKDEWRKKIPATTHVNNTARVQTVNKEIDPKYHYLINSLEKLNGKPVVLNTSFNIRGQPIVEKPLEAISTFAGTGVDCMIMGNYLFKKHEI